MAVVEPVMRLHAAVANQCLVDFAETYNSCSPAPAGFRPGFNHKLSCCKHQALMMLQRFIDQEALIKKDGFIAALSIEKSVGQSAQKGAVENPVKFGCARRNGALHQRRV